MIDVQEIEDIWDKIPHTVTLVKEVEYLKDLAVRLAAERDAYREVWYKIENEWRNRETWIRDKRPPEIRAWVAQEAAEIIKQKEQNKID